MKLLSTRYIVIFAASVLIAIGIGFFVGRQFAAPGPASSNSNKPEPASMTETRSGGYRFINPLLECDAFTSTSNVTVFEMEKEVRNYIAAEQAANKVSHVSVYFRDLNNGPWMGINERENYSPASLLKVPVLIAVLKEAEANKELLNQKLTFTGALQDKNIGQNIVDGELIKPGGSYTVADLLQRMIEFSDNGAKDLLVNAIGVDKYDRTLTDLGVIIPGERALSDFMPVRDYSTFFRILYNATYLSSEMSEKALLILSKTRFDKGLLAGVPAGTLISHKFGERAYEDADTKQLHDCGIVYAGGKPYLLCVMTRGKDFVKMQSVIARISAIVYKKVTTE
ncbi:MAG TPA: serine hydrolase [Chitinophagales bacterium]|nr:serine hydrolase [Chitinophagales bacterium]